MALADEGTPLRKLQDAFGGEGLPNLGIAVLTGTTDSAKLLEDFKTALFILNGVDDDTLEIKT